MVHPVRKFVVRAVGSCLVLASLLTTSLPSSSLASEGRVYVRGHVRSNGSYVMPHYRSSPDRSFWNNWSTRGNVNPYTGQLGTRSYPSYGRSYPSLPSYNYNRVRAYEPYRSYRVPSYSPSYGSLLDDDEAEVEDGDPDE